MTPQRPPDPFLTLLLAFLLGVGFTLLMLAVLPH